LPPLAPNNLRNVGGVNPLVSEGWQDRSTQTMIKELQGPEACFESLSGDARRRIRRATEQGYTVSREPWPERLDDYYAVHLETYGRTGARPHPRAYFELIVEMARRGRAVLWVCRTPDGEPVAFHNTAQFGMGAVYWTGCSRTDHAGAGVNYLLFWNAIRGASEEGIRYYEVGEVFPDAADRKLQGLSQFKSKFGGRLHPIFRGEYPIASQRSWFETWMRW
jgi:lipid II:glycine glycyltransferase (peptidoglycan interpeptide bridge formation enzyme)